MDIFATSRSFAYWVCALVVCSKCEASTDASQSCTRPLYKPGLLQFFQIDGLWFELNDTSHNHFPAGTKIIFQCENAGIAVLEGMSEIFCLSSGWSENAPSCHDVYSRMISVKPAYLPRMVDVNGSLTIFLPPLNSDFTLEITCQVSVSGEPSLSYSHIKNENERTIVGQERGDSAYHEEYLILTPPRENDSGSFSCQDRITGDSCYLEIRLHVSSSPISRPTFTFPTRRRTFGRQEGAKLTLGCNATDSMEVWWEHRTWSRMKIVAVRSHLNLVNISLSDQGSYLCVAKGFKGQIVESKLQTLIIPDFAQVLLTTVNNYSVQTVADNESNTFFQNFRSAKFEVFSISNDVNTGLRFHLGKWLKSKNHYNAILEEITDLVREFTGNLSYVQNFDFWMEGLSFCIEESEDTAAGILTFPSTNITSTMDSLELCIASTDVPRGSRNCDGDLVSPATWKDTVVHNCFKTSATNFHGNENVLVQHFFKEVGEAEVTSSNVSFISRDLADITSYDTISQEDICNVTNILEKVSKVKSSSPTVTSNVLETIDNIVRTATRMKETSLKSETSSSIIKSLENQLETVKRSGSNFSANRPNIAVEVVQLQNIEASVTFASLQSEHNNISETKLSQDPIPLDQGRIQASIQIPRPVLQLSSNCIFANKSGQESFPFTFTIHRSGALFNDPQSAENNLKQNTWIVSTSILCEISNLPKGSHISSWFFPTTPPELKRKGQCVFWDHDLYGNRLGGWSSKGCLDPVIGESGTYKCSCGHMPKFANFAVLMDLKGNINSKALHILTVVGCVISIVGLTVTIVSYISIKQFRNAQPKQIVLNLCVAMLGLYCCFLIGINRTEQKLVCVIFGGLIHFFCLSTVAWMSVEATELYLLLVKVIGVHVKNFLRRCLLIAWGLPFVVVAICVAVTKESYAHEYCFPESTTYVFFIGVFGLVAVMLAYNVVMYIAIIWNLSVTSKNIAQSQTNRKRVLPRLKNAFAISVLLGLSWLFGFLAIGSMRMTFNILFCLFNSFQGFVIFLLFCARQEEVRAGWGKWLGITIAQSMTDGNISTSEKPTTSTAQRVTSYDSNTRKVDS